MPMTPIDGSTKNHEALSALWSKLGRDTCCWRAIGGGESETETAQTEKQHGRRSRMGGGFRLEQLAQVRDRGSEEARPQDGNCWHSGNGTASLG
jgi:hypothetical protein